MSTPTDPLFPPFGKPQQPNPYSQGLPENTPQPSPYSYQPAPNNPYAPPPAEAYRTPDIIPPQGQYAPPPVYTQPPVNNPYYTAPVVPTVNSLALWSMIAGIAGILLYTSGLGILGSIAAIILGHMGLYKIKNYPSFYNGKGFAITGLILGYAALAFFILMIGFFILLFFSGYY